MTKAGRKARAFARYVGIGPLDLLALVDVARSQGMKCIAAYKPNMHWYNEIALLPDVPPDLLPAWSLAAAHRSLQRASSRRVGLL